MSLVWIVMQEDSPFNPVIGVFATVEEAESFSQEIKGQFSRGVVYSSFQIGYRFDSGPGHVGYGPDS
jgi:hypothetical protein